jgi:hypothetical protein
VASAIQASPAAAGHEARCCGHVVQGCLFPGKRVTMAYRVQDGTRSEPPQAPGQLAPARGLVTRVQACEGAAHGYGRGYDL